MKERTTNLLLGIIAACLVGLLLKETAFSVKAQSSARSQADGQAQISSSNGMIYILMDRKIYAYTWESKESKALMKSFGVDLGSPKLKRMSVIDLPTTH